LPKKMRFTLIEPLKSLFKDEVRRWYTKECWLYIYERIKKIKLL
jgi:GMP synthase PP-ATPase subunit